MICGSFAAVFVFRTGWPFHIKRRTKKKSVKAFLGVKDVFTFTPKCTSQMGAFKSFVSYKAKSGV